MAHSSENLAMVAAATHDCESAVWLFGAADTLRARIGAPSTAVDREFNERLLAQLRADMGEDAFAAAWSEGASMEFEEAIAHALDQGKQSTIHGSGLAPVDD